MTIESGWLLFKIMISVCVHMNNGCLLRMNMTTLSLPYLYILFVWKLFETWLLCLKLLIAIAKLLCMDVIYNLFREGLFMSRGAGYIGHQWSIGTTKEGDRQLHNYTMLHVGGAGLHPACL